MKEETDIELQLSVYASAFDEFVDTGRYPVYGEEDVLMAYLVTVFEDCLGTQWWTDEILRDLLKNSILEFFSMLLSCFQQIEQRREIEWKYINAILNVKDLERKEELWEKISDYLMGQYSQYELNVGGYNSLLKQGEFDMDILFQKICDEWSLAYRRKIREEKQRCLNSSKKQFESSVGRSNMKDYRIMSRYRTISVKYKELKEIVSCMGREKEQTDELDTLIKQYIPETLSSSLAHSDIHGVEEGNDLQALMPTEVALLAEIATEDLFFMKYAMRQLQLFSGRSDSVWKKQESRAKRREPRQIKGPMIVAIDTSGSMQGKAESIAKALLMEITQMAKKQCRKCFLLSFSVRAQVLNTAHPGNWKKVREFMVSQFSGGTDGEEMLTTILHTLTKENYLMADVLIISDFEFAFCCKSTESRIRREQERGVHFYGLQIGNGLNVYKELLDKVWRLDL